MVTCSVLKVGESFFSSTLTRRQFSSVLLISVQSGAWCLCARKNPYALRPVCQTLPPSVASETVPVLIDSLVLRRPFKADPQ